MRKTLLLLLPLSLGCAAQLEGLVRRQASFDFDCAPARVKVVETGPDGLSMRLNICGKERVYHSGAQNDPLWHVQPIACTDAASAPASASSVSVQPAQPVATTPTP